MATQRATLRIRRGEQTYGPMTLDKAEELLAKGRLQETDLVAESDGPWLPLKVWRGQRTRSSADGPLFDDTPLFSGPAGFDPNYVPLSDADVPAITGRSTASVPVQKPRVEARAPAAPTVKLEGSGELKADDDPAPRRSATKSAEMDARPSSRSMKTRPSSTSIKSRSNSESIPVAPLADESSLDALLQSLAEDARKAPPATPGRKLPPRRL